MRLARTLVDQTMRLPLRLHCRCDQQMATLRNAHGCTKAVGV
jgi:hypothetical protein